MSPITETARVSDHARHHHAPDSHAHDHDHRPGPDSAASRLDSPALIADGLHARSDAIVSTGVILSAIAVALGAPIADPLIGLAITGLILRIT